MNPEEAQRIKEEMAAKEYELNVKPSLRPKATVKTEQPQAENVAQTEMPEWLKTLTIAEALELPEFKKNLKDLMKATWDERLNIYYKGGKIKNDPIKHLDEGLNEWNTHAITKIYQGCLNKTLDTNRYSARIREFVMRLGDLALNRTVETLKKRKEDQQ
jgi:hypothetical protein